jgi:hypothetical protein
MGESWVKSLGAQFGDRGGSNVHSGVWTREDLKEHRRSPRSSRTRQCERYRFEGL